MPAIKRSPSEELDELPNTQSSSGNDSSEDLKPTPKKARKTPTKKKVKGDEDSPKERQVARAWTEAEDAIFVELMTNMLKNGLWPLVKEDGRLEYRGNQGVRARVLTLMNKLKASKA